MSANAVQQLARVLGVQTEYLDATGKMHQASGEVVLEVLRSLGAPLARWLDAADAARCYRERVWREGIEPVIVAWDGRFSHLLVRLAESSAGGHGCLCTLDLEDGSNCEWWIDLAKSRLVESRRVEGVYYTARQLCVPCPPLPFGYHRLRIEIGCNRLESTIIAAPRQAHTPGSHAVPTWGLFAPVYALSRPDGWGSGDFTDLEQLLDRVRQRGGGMVATLPLLAAMLEHSFEPSPYAPASRLFWNEFYLDVERVPELERSPAARQLLASAMFQRELQELRATDLVDYRRGMAAKRRVLELLSQEFFAHSSPRRQQFQEFVGQHDELEDYAAFRAAGQRFQQSWHGWPAAARDGHLRLGDYDPAERNYHLYVQWLCHQAIERLARHPERSGLGLYLDLPVGVSSDSFDVWRYRDQYVPELSVGSPPDPTFPAGQDWGFPPLHPLALRQHGYSHLRAYLRHHMQMAGVLRIDHVMGLMRLYCIPRGGQPSEGAYVRYRGEEMFAVLCLESHRNQTLLVGEDLGTVPPEIPQTMQRHGVRRMYVMQYEAQPDAELPDVLPGAVAALNTHDMPPMAAFWQQSDIDERLAAGILTAGQAEAARRQRCQVIEQLSNQLLPGELLESPAPLRDACLKFLAESGADLVVVNIEDLWNATASQNLPGTAGDWPNWRRKLPADWQARLETPEVLALLRQIQRARRQALSRPAAALATHSMASTAMLSGPNSI
jgi:4-alpha-glucanotransferase